MDSTIGNLSQTAAVLLTDKVPKEPTAGPPAEYYTISQLKTLLDTIYAPVTGGAYVLKAGDTMTGLLTIAQATANTSALVSTGYSLTGANAQPMLSWAGTWNTSGIPTAISLNITDTASNAASLIADWKVNGLSKFSIRKNGLINHVNSIEFNMAVDNTPMFTGPGVGITGAASTVVAEFNSLWVTSGTPTGLQVGVIDLAASGTESFLFNAVFNTVSAFSVRKDGLVRVTGSILFTNNSFDVGAAGATSPRTGYFGTSLFVGGTTTAGLLGHRTFGAISFSSDGVWALRDNATTSFGRLQFGGTTSAFPSIKRTGAGLEVKLADDSAYAVITASMLRLTPALTVATLPAAGTQGRIAYVTDALAPAFLAVVVGGGAIITTVFDNGTNWVSV